MKVLSICLLALMCVGFGDNKSRSLEVYVTQGGRVITTRNHEVKLRKKTFELNFPFKKSTSFLVNCSFNDSTYRSAAAGEPIESLIGFVQSGLAEGRFNTERDVMVADKAPSYWFHDSENETRFDTIVQLDKKLKVAVRTIEQVFDVDQRSHLPLSSMKRPLYFVFIEYVYDRRLGKRVELKRNWLKVNW